MTALHNPSKPVCVRICGRAPGVGVASHQEATLLALHFRSASWTPCVSGPTLLAAAAVVRSVRNPGAQWDAWFFRRNAACPSPCPDCGEASSQSIGRIGATRRSRLHAAALAWSVGIPGTPWVMVLEERTSPGSATRGRRLVVELSTEPFAADSVLAPIDPRVVAAVGILPPRELRQSNPSPDVSVDLEALGLIAPRAESW